jgi:Xaa-Pro aminopeptidase
MFYALTPGVLDTGGLEIEHVLADAGARTRMYCSDITRCYPASGQFTTDQRAVYDVVWRAHDAGIAAAVPGAPVSAIHDAALRVRCRAWSNCVPGWRSGRALRNPTSTSGSPHRTSHCSASRATQAAVTDSTRVLQAGMVLTVEPDSTGAPGGPGRAARTASGWKTTS